MQSQIRIGNLSITDWPVCKQTFCKLKLSSRKKWSANKIVKEYNTYNLSGLVPGKRSLLRLGPSSSSSSSSSGCRVGLCRDGASVGDGGVLVGDGRGVDHGHDGHRHGHPHGERVDQAEETFEALNVHFEIIPTGLMNFGQDLIPTSPMNFGQDLILDSPMNFWR